MPRKDGLPTAKERKNAERVAANAAFIARLDDDELARAEDLFMLDEEIEAQVLAERRRRST
jgi:hypothetical protein